MGEAAQAVVGGVLVGELSNAIGIGEESTAQEDGARIACRLFGAAGARPFL